MHMNGYNSAAKRLLQPWDFSTGKQRRPDRQQWSFLRLMPPRTASTCSSRWSMTIHTDLADATDLMKSLKGGCSAGYRVANIDPWGNVYPCQFARSPDFFIGNIRDRFFRDLADDDESGSRQIQGKKINRGKMQGVWIFPSLWRGVPGSCPRRVQGIFH